MYATPAQIGAPALWAQVGGQANAGAGVKVAIIDSGIYVTKDASGNYAGNPCFNDAGYTRAARLPEGRQAFTNNKVIVARATSGPRRRAADRGQRHARSRARAAARTARTSPARSPATPNTPMTSGAN